MSQPTTGGLDAVRPLAVRLLDSVRGQIDAIAQINGRSTTEEIRVAIEYWVEHMKSDPGFAAKAKKLEEDIEREAQAKREAIASFFVGGDVPDGEAQDGKEKDAAKASIPRRTRAHEQ